MPDGALSAIDIRCRCLDSRIRPPKIALTGTAGPRMRSFQSAVSTNTSTSGPASGGACVARAARFASITKQAVSQASEQRLQQRTPARPRAHNSERSLLHEQLCELLGHLTSAAKKPRREMSVFPESHHERLAVLSPSRGWKAKSTGFKIEAAARCLGLLRAQTACCAAGGRGRQAAGGRARAGEARERGE
jgi:hypothetical protein